MIGKHTLGRGFRGLLSYLLREGMPGREDEAILLGGNLSGRNARELAREFGVFRRLNPDVSRPVFHASLRLPAGESLSDAQWLDAAGAFLARMGYTDSAYVVIRHPEHHIHIVASRVRFDGSTVQTWKDRWRSLEAVADLERQFGLSQPRVRPGLAHRPVPSRISPAERAMGERRGERLPKEILAERLDRALAQSDGSRESFDRVLTTLGVEARWNIARTGRVHGATFHLLDYQGPLQATMKGSAIGPAFAWQQLAARLAAREREYLTDLGRVYIAEVQRQQVSRRLAPSWQPAVRRAPSHQEGSALPAGGRGGPATNEQHATQPVDVVSDRLVRDAGTILAQQGRWNRHLGEDAVLRLAALRLGKEHPDAGAQVVLAALERARPGSLATFPGGQAALTAQLEAMQAARAHERAPAPWEERDYGTR